MSADNGYIVRKNEAGEYVLQMYFASADKYPPIDSPNAEKFDTLEAAVLGYEKLDNESLKEGYPLSEYGLTIRITKNAKEAVS